MLKNPFHALLTLLVLAACSSPPLMRISLENGNEARSNSPLLITTGKDLPAGSKYTLVNEETNRESLPGPGAGIRATIGFCAFHGCRNLG